LKTKIINIIKVIRANLELLTWLGILIVLFFSSPDNHSLSLCSLDNLGFEYCPGCGLGRSCMHALNGNFVDSFYSHPLGIIAIFIIVFRIVTLTRNAIKYKTFKIKHL
jgi:hypothetical protein